MQGSIKGDLTVSGSISDKDRHLSTSPTTNIMTNSVITWKMPPHPRLILVIKIT